MTVELDEKRLRAIAKDAAAEILSAASDYNRITDIVEAAIRAYEEAAPKGEVVKPLEWDDNCAETPFGSYTVTENNDDEWEWTFHCYPYGEPNDKREATMEAAKAAAQADYSARILSALASPPPARELPEDLRVPLHSLQADLDYLVARIASEDDEVRGMLKDSIRSRLSQIEEASYRLNASPPASPALVRELVGALENAEETLRLVEQPAFRDPNHGDEVEKLRERIGYGALMSSASASWRARMIKQGLTAGSEFVAGPCHVTVERVLSNIRAALTTAREAGYGEER